MIKVKSKSRDMRNSEHPRYAAPKRSISKENRALKTTEHRNYSNQYIPVSHYFGDPIDNIRGREFSSTKTQRKDFKLPEADTHPLKNVPQELKESKKYNNNKTFIGSKLRRRMQKYLLFISLVNFSLRVNYERSEAKRYKIFVGKGNNSKLVKAVFTSRFWWTITQDQNQANIVWTQKSRKKIFATINNLEKEGLKLGDIQQQAGRRKLKVKRRDHKKVYFDEEMQNILCQKDRFLLKSECTRQNFNEDLKQMIRKLKNQKRKHIKVTHNHIENHRLLTNKKNLFYNLKRYCETHHDDPFNYVPLTFHIKGSEEEFKEITDYQEQRKEKEKLLWIVKPGENSNRGCGIEICKKVDQIRRHIDKQKQKHPDRTFIVQKYINPFLFHRRKFDIRCFVLVTATPFISAYFYPTGYIRTSSFEFSMKNCSNKYIHLTNDAIQKKASEYSKFESGNKVRFEQFQKYLDMFQGDKNLNFYTDVLPIMRDLVIISIKSARNFEESNKEHTFQILGYDFMLDDEMQPWLIEINTNPCLQTGCEILNEIIPSMLENVVKIAVDPVFKPPKMQDWSLNDLLCCSEKLLQGNKFELIYSQIHEH